MAYIAKYPRSAGVLMPVTMLHGPFGIGVLGAEAREFIDFLSGAGFHAWQILPIEHTGKGFSPYKCLSAFAGEPMLIDPRMLLTMGLIGADDLKERASGVSVDFVDYGLIKDKQQRLLKKAYSRLQGRGGAAAAVAQTAAPTPTTTTTPTPTPTTSTSPATSVTALATATATRAPATATRAPATVAVEPMTIPTLAAADWLDAYALYIAIKAGFNDKPWYEWPDESLRRHDASAVKEAGKELREEIGFYKFVQSIFNEQWRSLREYAASRGVSIIGDMPFYVSEDSAEVWSRRRLFNADPNGKFAAVGGAPPDYFSPNGQHWGNPVYNWPVMKKEGYKWWVNRIGAALDRYDYVRLDHFRGFDSYWSIPWDAPDARGGRWVRGPGMALFEAIEVSLGKGNMRLIAEDLGDTHGNVDKLLADTGLRGMRVLQFGFLGDDKHLPHNITEDCVAYTGTHDNTTLLAWLFELAPQDRERALFYIGFDGDWTKGGPNCSVVKAWIRALFASGASLAVVPIQDLLGYGADTRTNTPGAPEGNWRFRIRADATRRIDAGFYKTLIETTLRDNKL